MTTPNRSTVYRRTALRTVALAATFAVNVAAFASCGGGTKETVAPIDTTKPNADQYVNPVINADFPDPSALRASDGFYYAYATQTTGVRVQVARSSDLVAWTKLGEAMPVKPTWATTSNNFWAPDVHQFGATYLMYFTSDIDADKKLHADDGKCIGVATATTAAGPFTDVGAPLMCGPGFTTIDPMEFADPTSGKHYLYWGSDGAPIKVKELSADGLSFADASAPVPVVTTSGVAGSYDANLVEGAWVTYHAPYYYLYYSGNNCCGSAVNVHYAVMVARSSSPTGPFEVLKAAGSAAAKPILQSGGPWIAPGHNSTVTDDAGAEWMVYHAINSANPYLIPGNTTISRRPMLIDPITYVNGWPVVGTGVPSSTPQTRPKKNP